MGALLAEGQGEEGLRMERRAASHTEEEEMNQRRRLLNLARKGDAKAISRLFELYQVRVYSGDNLKKVGRLPFAPPKLQGADRDGKRNHHARRKAELTRRRLAARQAARKVAQRKRAKATHAKSGRKAAPRAHR